MASENKGDSDSLVTSSSSSGDVNSQLVQQIKADGVWLFIFKRFLTVPFLVLFAGTTLVPMIYGALYINSMWNPSARLNNLDMGINVHDVPADFTAIQSELQLSNQSTAMWQAIFSGPTGYQIEQAFINNFPSVFSFSAVASSVDSATLNKKIMDGDYWGALYIPPEFTTDIVILAIAGTIPQHPMEFRYDQGRNYATLDMFNKALEVARKIVQQAVGQKVLNITEPLASQGIRLHPNFIAANLAIKDVKLTVVSKYGANFASYITAVVLCIGSMVTVMQAIRYSMDAERLAGESAKLVKAKHVMAIRVGFIILQQLLQSLFLSFLFLMLDADINKGFGSLFLWFFYTSLAYTSMNGFLCVVIGMDVFQLPAAILLILQLTTCGGIVSEKVMPGFFELGVAFPFYYAVRGVRTILFGSYDTMFLNSMIILVWIIVPFIGTFILGRRNMHKRWAAIKSSAVMSTLTGMTGFGKAETEEQTQQRQVLEAREKSQDGAGSPSSVFQAL